MGDEISRSKPQPIPIVPTYPVATPVPALEPSGRPTLQEIGRGRFGYRDVIAYYDRTAARVLRKRITLPGRPFYSREVEVVAFPDGKKKFARRLLDLTFADIVRQLRKQFKNEDDVHFGAHQILNAIPERFHFPVRLKGIKADCIKTDGTRTRVSVDFKIEVPVGVNPASITWVNVNEQVGAQLFAANVRFAYNDQNTDVVTALYEELKEALNDQFDPRAVQNYFLPEHFAELNPGRSEEENKDLSLMYVNKVIEKMKQAEGGQIKRLLENLQDKKTYVELFRVFAKGLAPSEAEAFLDKLVKALEKELGRYDPKSTTKQVVKFREDLTAAIKTAKQIDPESIMLAPLIDTENKFKILIKLLEAEREEAMPPLAR